MLALAAHPPFVAEVFVAQHVVFVAAVAFLDELVEGGEQLRLIRAQHPAQGALRVEPGADVEPLVERGFDFGDMAVCQREVQLAAPHALDQGWRGDVHQIDFDADVGGQAAQRFREAGAGLHRHPPALKPRQRVHGRSTHKHLPHRQVRLAERQPGADAALGDGDAGGDEVATPRCQPRLQIGAVGHHDGFEHHALAIRERLHQLVFEADQLTLPQVVGGGAVQGEHPQAAVAPNLREIAPRGHVVSGEMSFLDEGVQGAEQLRVVVAHRPSVLPGVRQLAQLANELAGRHERTRHHPIHDGRVELPSLQCLQHLGRVHPGAQHRERGVGEVRRHGFHIGRCRRHTEAQRCQHRHRRLFRGDGIGTGRTDDPLPRGRERRGEGDLAAPRIRHREVRHRHVRKPIAHRRNQFMEAIHDAPLHRKPTLRPEPLGQLAVALRRQALARQGVEPLPAPPRQTQHAGLGDGVQVARGPRRPGDGRLAIVRLRRIRAGDEGERQRRGHRTSAAAPTLPERPHP